MKRPEGFDKRPAAAPAARPQRAPAPAISLPLAEKAPTARQTRAQLRQARRQRRSYEKGEVRRFTRRARSRRRTIAAVAGILVVFLGIVAVAIFSPALALREIRVEGTSRLEAATIEEALGDQIGTPLALVDFDEITRQLSAFSVIRSYTTESIPPHTLLVSIVERVGVGVVGDGDDFALVDPAGVVLESVADRIAGVPLIDAGEASIGNPAFASAVEVLLALPPELLARVDTVTATTKDDVNLLLDGGAQSVIWGSADRSAFKARVLAALVATQDPAARLEYDVSAADAPVVRRVGG